jgi:FKBP-type peptidyl-prolyl cis-trans isomerase
MKSMRVLFVFSLICLFIVSACSQDKKYASVKLKTREDTVSYYLGLTYGNGIKQAKIDSLFNAEAFLRGIHQATKEDSLPVSSFVIQNFLNKFFSELQQKQVKKQYKDYIEQNKVFLETNAKKDSVKTLPSGLQYVVLKEGSGKKPTLSDRIKVHYTGTLIDGTVFDSSYKRNQPAEFGVGQVIPGWTEALQLMSVGSKYRIFIPENLAYGSQAPQGSAIKPYSTLIFVVELLEILPATEPGK